jgi:membrane protein implicated in regulation of membrane protease activity
MDVDTLNCVYMVLFFIGVGYALFTVVTGGLSSVDMPDVNIDIPQIDLPGDVGIPGADISVSGGAPVGGLDAPDVHVSPLSPITIATFITTFGGLGALSLELLDIDPRFSLLIAAAGATVLAGVVYVFYSQFLIRSQASSEVRRGEIVGYHAEVTVPIGEASLGKVSYTTKAGRMSSMARSTDGSAIRRGELVEIVRVVGNQVLVRPLVLETEDQDLD